PRGRARYEERVDDHLGTVDEVPVLGLPEHQRLWRLDAVAVLKAQRGALGERAVVDVEGRSLIGQGSQRREGRTRFRVVKRQVTLAERAADGVMAGKQDRNDLGHQDGEGERLDVDQVDGVDWTVSRDAPTTR